MLQLLLVIRWRQFKKQIKNRTFYVALSSRKKWKLSSLNCIFHYISNWSNVLDFYLKSLFNTKSLRVKFRNFLGNISVHYEALFINRTTNNNYMTFLVVLHHTHDGFLYYFRYYKSNTHSRNISSFESVNKKPSFNLVAASFLM